MSKEFICENYKGVVYFRSEGITTPHGFSTRLGGVSSQPHLAEMNLGKNLGDDPDAVEENYRRMGEAVGFDHKTVVFTNQIHSNIVKRVGVADIAKTYDCDGFVTNERNVTLAVRTADCVPILMYDERGIIGAVHAGWRGTANRIQCNAVNEMVSLGASPESIKVAIGACIHKCCYEVGEDFCISLTEILGKEITQRHIETRQGRVYCDLVSLNKELLISCGIDADNITVSDDCTCCRSELYFSHRATKGKRGVMSAFISL
ncbi:MAG: peptidoglycan editing factor PgeF [Ruminococcaceae bacterium]|nr:peptidoglycan editing factor PgeF [Oscillospiraceae bacterium]